MPFDFTSSTYYQYLAFLFAADRPAPTSEGINAMKDTASDLDQTDEDILTYEVSDETLEAAAGAERSMATFLAAYSCALTCC